MDFNPSFSEESSRPLRVSFVNLQKFTFHACDDRPSMKAVGGDVKKRDALIKAMQTAKIDSPRGPFSLSKANNPVQDYYLRQVVNKQNKAIGVAVKGYADPATGCKM